jgi:hypothetical protein
MKSFLKSQFLVVAQTVLLTAVLFFIHDTIFAATLPKVSLLLSLYKIYFFHFIVTTTIIIVVNQKNLQKGSNVFNVFMLFTLVKMLLALVFLLPVFLSDLKTRNYDVVNFFIPYFIYLAFEVFVIIKPLQNQN